MFALVSSVVHAQSSETSVSTGATATKRSEELFEIRLRYGLAYRSGSQRDMGPGLGYDGLTPNDPSIHAWVWPILDGLIGFSAGFGREGFALFDRTTNARVTGGGLLRGQAAATARFRLGPARLEPVIGYSLAQIADFGESTTPTFRPGTRHGLLLAARGLVDVGPVSIEGRFEYPLSLAATDGSGATARSSGLWVGGGVRLALVRTGTALWGLMLDGAYSNDSLVSASTTSAQSHFRGGVALDLQWKDPEPTVQVGSVRVTVQLDTGAPAPQARLTLETSAGTQAAALDENGVARLTDLSPGSLTARATLEGYEAAETTTSVATGTEAAVVLRLKKEAPKLGSLVVTVVDKSTKSALAGASVKVGERSASTDARGSVRFDSLKPGAVNVDVAAAGFGTLSEATTIVAGVEGNVGLELTSAKKREPATVSGFIRSASDGSPVNANLEIPEAAIKTRADAKGSFVFRLTGGTYTVSISARGFSTQTKQVTVKDGDQAIFNVDLQPK
jgi:hypothetical protein